MSMRAVGLVAMQMLMFVLAGIGVSAATGQRPDACGEVPADRHRLIRAGLIGYGG
jgi:hypothetical protein